MPDEPLFSWLHLSDVHSGAGTTSYRIDAQMVMRRLEQDLERILREGTPKPDVLFVTGDVAFSGNNRSDSEYEEAQRWLQRMAVLIGQGPGDVYSVPGNHDVNRSVANNSAEVRSLLNELRSGAKQIEEAMENDKDAQCLKLRQQAYANFAGYHHLKSGDVTTYKDFCWTRHVKARGGLHVHLVGLNTALLAQDDTDRGLLRLGKQQLSMIQPACRDDKVILLTHHPLDWLADREEVRGWIRSNVHIHLYGHIHEAENLSLLAGGMDHQFVEVVAGAVHSDENEPPRHGFSVGSIVRSPRGLVVRIWPCAWSDRNKDFRPDVDNIRLDRGHLYAEYVLDEMDRVKQVLVSGTAPRPPNSPAAPLNARHEVVPFFEDTRKKELDQLEHWCHKDPRPTSVRLFIGPGGTGKTRLFIEYARRLSQKPNWQAGFPSNTATEQDIDSLLSVPKPVLMVIDYAETHPSLLALLKRVAGRKEDQAPLRVALLARDVGDWWQSLLSDADVRDLLKEDDPVRLEQISVDSPLRNRAFVQAREAFAKLRKKTADGAIPDLSDERFGRMLYLQMAALASLEGLPTNADTLLDEIVSHEKSFWLKAFTNRTNQDDLKRTGFEQAASRTMAAITLRGGVESEEDAIELCRRVRGPNEETFIPILADQYIGRSSETHGRYMTGLKPDLLGEHLVAGVLTHRHTPKGFLSEVFLEAPQPAIRNGFAVLGRISLWSEERAKQAKEWLAQVLQADVVGRYRAAFDAASSLARESAFAPLGTLLTESLEKVGTIEIAAELEPLIPPHTVALGGLAVWATQRLLEVQRPPSDRALLLNRLGNRLFDVGRREEGVKAMSEAAEIRRGLAAKEPDAFLSDFATSLNNLGSMLSELRRYDDAFRPAKEAEEIRRKLADDKPDVFLPDLAISVNNLGNTLNGLGLKEEALASSREAVDIYRRLATVRPDLHRSNLATALNNIANRLSELGRCKEALEAAQESVDIRRKLVGARPDETLPELVASLYGLSGRLAEVGLHEEALKTAKEAVERCRGLVRQQPAAFLPRLAKCLSNITNIFGQLEHPQDALTNTDETAEVRRRDALAMANEAVEIYGQLAKKEPATFGRDFLISRKNLTVYYEECGRPAELEESIRRAVEIEQQLGLVPNP